MKTFMGYPIEQGMVRVDAWLIPIDEAETYIRQREICAAEVIRVMESFCTHVRRDLAGSEDGEVVLGDQALGTERGCLIFLDPPTIEEILPHLDDGTLKEYILAGNELTDLI